MKRYELISRKNECYENEPGEKAKWEFRSETRHLISKPRPITVERPRKFSFLITRGNGLCFFSIQPISPYV